MVSLMVFLTDLLETVKGENALPPRVFFHGELDRRISEHRHRRARGFHEFPRRTLREEWM